MKHKDTIIKLIRQKGKITSGEITSFVGVSRQYVNMVISELIAEDHVIKIGGTRSAFYVTKEYVTKHPAVVPAVFKKTYKNQSLEEHKVLLDIEAGFPKLMQLSENVRSIFTFAFSEMFNNAIEHSQSKVITVEVSVKGNELLFVVSDSGIGVFRNIMKKRKLETEIQAIQDLLKGKTTTMPKSHSGEGIFFTSKSGDLFILDSFGYRLDISTEKSDVSIHHVSFKKRGTKVVFSIRTDSDRHLNEVFKKYTNFATEGDYGFDKTEIRVKLYTTGGIHISRSQARRILVGLEKFKIIVFDYEQVPMVGQAFADEVYRVFQKLHPHIRLENEHMNEGVQFMIERAINEVKRRR